MNLFEFILDPTDMVLPRTPRELCAWIEGKTSTLSQRAEATAYARSGATLPKKLWEEIRPSMMDGSEYGITCLGQAFLQEARSRKDYYSMLLSGGG